MALYGYRRMRRSGVISRTRRRLRLFSRYRSERTSDDPDLRLSVLAAANGLIQYKGSVSSEGYRVLGCSFSGIGDLGTGVVSQSTSAMTSSKVVGLMRMMWLQWRAGTWL